MITIRAVNPLGTVRYFTTNSENAANELIAALRLADWQANLN